MTTRAILLLYLVPSAIFAADLQDLVSTSNDFEVEMIEDERVLERTHRAPQECSVSHRDGHRESTEDAGGGQDTGDLFGLGRNSREAIGGCHGFTVENDVIRMLKC
jgi:hypothetical protein